MATQHRWWYVLALVGAAVIVFALVASIVGSPPPPKPAANTLAPVPTAVQRGLVCSTEAAIEADDRGTLLICALAKDRNLRWRRV